MNIDDMKNKALLVMDPDSGYTLEDFDDEFCVTQEVTPEFKKIGLPFVNESNNPDPEYATDGASGFDLRANLIKPILIPSGGVEIIPTGLFFEIPANFEIQIRPRSGLAAKNGVTVLNTLGTIDADYRGEIKIILINHGKVDFLVNHGERIAQAVVSSVLAKNVINLKKVNSIDTNTDRGSGGFGSTGLE